MNHLLQTIYIDQVDSTDLGERDVGAFFGGIDFDLFIIGAAEDLDR